MGVLDALCWARGLEDPDRVWAIEDCRHVSGRLERLLISAGETVVRVPPRLMAGVRRSQRERGKSDPIDALAVARAAIREGVDRLPAAQLAGRELGLRLLLDDHDDPVVMRSQCQQRLRWHLHDLCVRAAVGESSTQGWLVVVTGANGSGLTMPDFARVLTQLGATNAMAFDSNTHSDFWRAGAPPITAGGWEPGAPAATLLRAH